MSDALLHPHPIQIFCGFNSRSPFNPLMVFFLGLYWSSHRLEAIIYTGGITWDKEVIPPCSFPHKRSLWWSKALAVSSGGGKGTLPPSHSPARTRARDEGESLSQSAENGHNKRSFYMKNEIQQEISASHFIASTSLFTWQARKEARNTRSPAAVMRAV